MAVGIRLGDDTGSVTAEFAMLLPVITVLLAVAVSAVMLATVRLSLTAAASDLARLEARGDAELAGRRLESLGGAVTVERSRTDGLLCVTLARQSPIGLLALIPVATTSCAAMTTGG